MLIDRAEWREIRVRQSLTDGTKGEEWDFDLLTPYACGRRPRCTRKKKRQLGSGEKGFENGYSLLRWQGLQTRARPELKLRNV